MLCVCEGLPWGGDVATKTVQLAGQPTLFTTNKKESGHPPSPSQQVPQPHTVASLYTHGYTIPDLTKRAPAFAQAQEE